MSITHLGACVKHTPRASQGWKVCFVRALQVIEALRTIELNGHKAKENKTKPQTNKQANKKIGLKMSVECKERK